MGRERAGVVIESLAAGCGVRRERRRAGRSAVTRTGGACDPEQVDVQARDQSRIHQREVDQRRTRWTDVWTEAGYA